MCTRYSVVQKVSNKQSAMQLLDRYIYITVYNWYKRILAVVKFSPTHALNE